jgi:thiol-disulfide isomerase/thioredoxin
MRFFVLAVLAAADIEGFDADVNAAHCGVTGMAEAKAKAKDEGKVLVAVVTEPWCGACKRLKSSINDSKEVKNLLGEFTVVLAEGSDGAEWKGVSGAGYIPQILFFDPTTGYEKMIAGANSGNDKYPYFFGSAQQLAVGMRTAMRAGAPKSDEL